MLRSSPPHARALPMRHRRLGWLLIGLVLAGCPLPGVTIQAGSKPSGVSRLIGFGMPQADRTDLAWGNIPWGVPQQVLAVGRTIYMDVVGYGLLKSADKGDTWTSVTSSSSPFMTSDGVRLYGLGHDIPVWSCSVDDDRVTPIDPAGLPNAGKAINEGNRTARAHELAKAGNHLLLSWQSEEFSFHGVVHTAAICEGSQL